MTQPTSEIALRNGQLQKIKINHMLESIKRSQGTLPGGRKIGYRDSIGMSQYQEGRPPLLKQ